MEISYPQLTKGDPVAALGLIRYLLGYAALFLFFSRNARPWFASRSKAAAA
jgi:hypothetical protein